jgi:hypothetical protein
MFPAFPTPLVNTLLPKPPKNPSSLTLSVASTVIFPALPCPNTSAVILLPLVNESEPVFR